MNNTVILLFAGMSSTLAALAADDCGDRRPPSSDDIQHAQQEKILQEGTAAIGMPAITHFRERKLLKTIYELRDQADLSTYTYIWSDLKGPIFICHSIGYGIPYAIQFTNPQKVDRVQQGNGYYGYYTLPQADPNGLFSPASAEGTWVMCKDPAGNVKPQYIEPRILVMTYELEGTPLTQSSVLPPAPVTQKK